MSWGRLIYNACSRCRGTMVRDRDRFGTYLQCLQCAHVVDLIAVPLTTEKEPIARMKKRTGAKIPDLDHESVGTS